MRTGSARPETGPNDCDLPSLVNRNGALAAAAAAALSVMLLVAAVIAAVISANALRVAAAA